MKRMGVGVIFFNAKKEVLLVKPSYKDHWTLPGGVVDADESPLHAAQREVKEELRLKINQLRFLCVAYVPAGGIRTESLQFTFYGGVLSRQSIKRIRLSRSELSSYEFVIVRKALALLSKTGRQRLAKCMGVIKKPRGIYLEAK